MSPVLSDLQQLVYLNRGNLCSGLFALQWECASGQTPLSKECRFSQPAEWYFCWEWGDNLEHTFECKLAWKHKNTRPAKQPIRPKNTPIDTMGVLLHVSFLLGESNLRQWIHWGRPKGPKACRDSVHSTAVDEKR